MRSRLWRKTREPAVDAASFFTLRVVVSDANGASDERNVDVQVQPVVGETPMNHPPVVSALTATPMMVSQGQTAALHVVASDADGDALSYAWTVSIGTFDSPSGVSPVWTAPLVSADTQATVTVTVTDGHGGSTVASIVLVALRENHAPLVTISVPTGLLEGETGTLDSSASDADGDSLSYQWTQDPPTPAGAFTSPNAATTDWTAPIVATDTDFELRLEVSDGHGGVVTKTAVILVTEVNVAPTITAGPSAQATTLDEQTSTTLSVSATDGDGDTLTYAWSQTSPASPLGSFDDATSATPTWTAPNVTANGTYTLRVTISDGRGSNIQSTINLTVLRENNAPNVSANITGPSTLVAGTVGNFSIAASDPDGDALSYAWTSPSGSFVGSTTSAVAQWYSSVISSQTSFTLTVTIGDGTATPVVRTITLPVTVPAYAASVQPIRWADQSSVASMRRFLRLPSSVSFGAAGRSSPKPTAKMREPSIPLLMR